MDGHRVKLRDSEKGDKCQDLARELKKKPNIKVTSILFVICSLSTVTMGLIQRMEGLKIKRRVETIQTRAILICHNTKSPGDMRRLAVTRTPVENYQLTLGGRNLK